MVNSRAILCIGSVTGDISIYYIDEPCEKESHQSHDRKKSADGLKKDLPSEVIKVRQVLHTTFTFKSNEEGHNGKGSACELTNIKYIRDIGLIVTSLYGSIKIFDGFNFKELWRSTNRSRKQLFHT